MRRNSSHWSRTIALFLLFCCSSLFALGCVKGCPKHVSSAVAAAKYCSLASCRFHPSPNTRSMWGYFLHTGDSVPKKNNLQRAKTSECTTITGFSLGYGQTSSGKPPHTHSHTCSRFCTQWCQHNLQKLQKFWPETVFVCKAHLTCSKISLPN